MTPNWNKLFKGWGRVYVGDLSKSTKLNQAHESSFMHGTILNC